MAEAGLEAASIASRLRCLGLSDAQARLYDVLLTSGPLTSTELAERAERAETGAAEVWADLEALADIGLVGGLRSTPSAITPLPPESALELLARRRELEVREASAAALRAFARYQRTIGTDGSRGLLEVVHGRAVIERVKMLERSARRSVRGLDCPPYHAGTAINPVEIENLRRGVAYRNVYASEAIQLRDYLDANILPAVKAGERARVLLHVPVKLLVIDESVAIVSLTSAETDVGHSALILQPCSLLSALLALWEMCWQSAVPLRLDGSPASNALEPVELRFLALLSTGVSDEQVASMLGISRRTFFRYLEQLFARTGTATRFQLATHASRQGWI